MGTPDFAVNSLEKILEKGHQVLAVITQPDRPKGRGKKLTPPPVKEKALDLGLKIMQPERIKDSYFIEKIKNLQPDVIVVVAFGQILPESILNLPPLGCINVHASLLPKYRGAAPIHWAIINGETKTGITTMFMDKGLDTGDMLLKEEVEIGTDITTGQLHDQLAKLGAELLVETLDKLEDKTIVPIPQEDAGSTYAPLLNKEHEKINWAKKAADIHNLVRGMNPWPGAYTLDNKKRLKIWSTKLECNIKRMEDLPGTVVELREEGFLVQTGDIPILITMVQPAGKKKMAASDYVNGYGLTIGTQLGDNFV